MCYGLAGMRRAVDYTKWFWIGGVGRPRQSSRHCSKAPSKLTDLHSASWVHSHRMLKCLYLFS